MKGPQIWFVIARVRYRVRIYKEFVRQNQESKEVTRHLVLYMRG